MKTILSKTKIVILIMLIALFANGVDRVWAVDSQKIGVINLQIALNTSEAGKYAMEKLKKDSEGKYNQVMAKEQSLKTLEERINSIKPTVMNEKERNELGETFYKQAKDLERLKEDFNGEMAKNEREMSSAILSEIISVARKIGQEEGYTIIMAKDQQIIFSIDDVDVTAKVIKRYDEEQKVK